MKDSAMPKVFLRAGMLLFHHFSGKCNAAFAGFRLDEPEKLLAGEVPGKRGHQVEETGLLFRIAEIPERFRGDREDLHNAKIRRRNSWSSCTRRKLAGACCP